MNDIRVHLGHRKQRGAVQDPFLKGFVIHYQADLRNHGAVNFHKMIATGKPVLWALDVEGYLSIGDPQSNKHSVVVAGKKVYGAGTAQLDRLGRNSSPLTSSAFGAMTARAGGSRFIRYSGPITTPSTRAF